MKKFTGLCALLTAGWFTTNAMQMNLAMPYGNKISGPSKAELAFYSKQSDDLLFTKKNAGKTIEIYSRSGLRCVGMKYSLHRNLFVTPFITGEAEALPDNVFVIRVPVEKLLFPGFYDLRVELDAGEEKPVPGLCTFGWRVAEMAIADTRPADFKEFWAKAKEKINAVPLAAEVGDFLKYEGKEIDAYNIAHAAIPGDYDPAGHKTETVEAAKVSFAGADGMRVHGWLAKPAGDGPFPAMLVLPGAGFNARPQPLEHARHGYLALDLQVHGQEVDLKEYPQIPGYYDQQIYLPPQDHYFYRVHQNVLQAINYLASRPDVDPKRIVVVGGSQGGRLTVVAASLDPRVAAAIPAIAHHANLPYSAWATAANKERSNGMDRELPPLIDTDEQKGLAYYDVMNFAPDIRCPVLMNAGLNDGVSFPTSVFAIYNRLVTKDRTMIALPGLAHDWSSEFDRRAWRWLEERLKNR